MSEALTGAISTEVTRHPDDLEEYWRNIERWGFDTTRLRLASRERHQLIARGQGWPWNGHELRRMKTAGRYPPGASRHHKKRHTDSIRQESSSLGIVRMNSIWAAHRLTDEPD